MSQCISVRQPSDSKHGVCVCLGFFLFCFFFRFFLIDVLRFLDNYKTINTISLTQAIKLMSKGLHLFNFLRGHLPDHVDILIRKVHHFYEMLTVKTKPRNVFLSQPR